ncbi:MAG TPA: SDR family oxidoreductase [Candidatus Limnocylindrales bacterium]|nr:SDR family oxidoreductase [Candidatus Limnocylindrales bacterium]
MPAAARRSTVLVVGGAGYIGSILSAELLQAGYEVRVLDSLLYGGQSLTSLIGRPGFELHVGDSRDEDVIQGLLADVSRVVHLGEIVGDPACNLDPEVTISVNFTATARLAELASDMGVERFVYASSCSVYGATEEIVDETGELNPVSLYAQLKIAAEGEILRLRSERFHPTVFRLATVYGRSPRQRFDLAVNGLAGRAVVDGRIVVQGGGQWRPFVHVADVASLLLETLEMPVERVSGEIFNLGSNDQNHTIGGIAEIVRDTVPETVVEIAPIDDHRNYRVAFDKVLDVLGFRASHTVRDGVREIVHAIEAGQIADIRDPSLSNVRALIETDARSILWRADFAGEPAAPFRPRDLEAARGGRLPAQHGASPEGIAR